MESAIAQSVHFSQEIHDDATQLREMAAGILRQPSVRAVVFDRRRLEVTIVPQRGKLAGQVIREEQEQQGIVE